MNFHKPLVFIQTVAIFLMAQRVSIQPRWQPLMQKLAKASFGVYAAHPLVMLGFTLLIPQFFPAIHLWQTAVIALVTSVISYIGVLQFQTVFKKLISKNTDQS